MSQIRTIITQDAEVDDQNSLRHFLFYANEVELQGIVQTSSMFHWIGVPGKVRTTDASRLTDDVPGQMEPYDQPCRWTGTDWMFEVADDYAKDYPSLSKHAKGYPTPEYIRSIIKIGNIGYEGEMDRPTEGSELIKKCILDEDERKLYIQVWGGTNTISRALLDIELEYGKTEQWENMHRQISSKIVLTACGEQDQTYRSYIAEKWPDIQFVKMLQMGSYAYPWFTMPEGESKDCLRASFMKKYIINGKSALTSDYCTWMDGKYYEGEIEPSQFGTNPNITTEWFGATMGLPSGQQYDFLSEGDSPTFFSLFPWGFRTLENFSYGGITGRYQKSEQEKNSKGESLNYWEPVQDLYIDRDGKETLTEGMWRYVADIQRDFAARVDWASKESEHEGEQSPSLVVAEGLDVSARAGEEVVLHATAESANQTPVSVHFEANHIISAAWATEVDLKEEDRSVSFMIPQDAKAGDVLHIIVKAKAAGAYQLVHYQQVILTVKE